MTRLNDKFLEAYTDKDGKLKIAPPIGYVLLEHEQDGMEVELRQTPWMEPCINVKGALKSSLLKGGVTLRHGSTVFEEGGLYQDQAGLHMGFDDEYGDRRYWIADSEDEEVRVSFWDPTVPTMEPDGSMSSGLYGDYSPVPEADAEIVRTLADGMITVAKNAIDAQLAIA